MRGTRDHPAGVKETALDGPQALSAEQMDVEMIHRLAGMGPRVREQAKAAVGHPPFRGEARADTQHSPNQRIMLGLRRCDGGEMRLGNEKNVHGILRLDVVKRDEVIILVDHVRRDFF